MTELARSQAAMRDSACIDRLVVADEEPPLGSHLITPRRGFTHHGIYVGRGKVVHYKSSMHGWCPGPVEEVSLGSFSLGQAIWIRRRNASRFDGAEVVRRARTRVGEDCYRLLTNNCEHFCEWCVHDEPRSFQVEQVLGMLRQLVPIFGRPVAALPTNDSGVSHGSVRLLRASPERRMLRSVASMLRSIRAPAGIKRAGAEDHPTLKRLSRFAQATISRPLTSN